MSQVATAFGRALRSLLTPAIFWHLVWPTVLSILLWILVAVLGWGWISDQITRLFTEVGWLRWLVQHWSASLLVGTWFAKLLLLVLLIPLIYGTALLIVAIFVLPILLDRVARADYPELERRDGGTFAGSLGNALVAISLFLLGWLLTLPLWLIPGMALVLPLLLTGYLNHRGYSYDALALHADARELNAVRRAERGGFYLVGLLAALLVFIPFFNLLVPAYAGLAFIHYALEALRRARGAAGGAHAVTPAA